MTGRRISRADRAQLAMVLEVCAFPKPGNVDRCHDYPSTRFEHFIASAILARPALEKAERGESSVGQLILEAVECTHVHAGGNTHFGAFLLLIPLVLGQDIPGACRVVSGTTVDDAVHFYEAFRKTQVRVLSHDDLDVHDPGAVDELRRRQMTLADVMLYSAQNDMVAREWINGFALTRRGADLLHTYGGGCGAVAGAFIELLSSEPDTFIIKKHGQDIAWATMRKAREVRDNLRDIVKFDQECIDAGINPGSIADIIIASLYIALGEGWAWDC